MFTFNILLFFPLLMLIASIPLLQYIIGNGNWCESQYYLIFMIGVFLLTIAVIVSITVLYYQQAKYNHEQVMGKAAVDERKDIAERDTTLYRQNQERESNMRISAEQTLMREKLAGVFIDILGKIEPKKDSHEWPDKVKMDEILRLLKEYKQLLND